MDRSLNSQTNRLLDRHASAHRNFRVGRVKKAKYPLQEGYLKLTVDFSKSKPCSFCPESVCKHLTYLYLHHFKLPVEVIGMLSEDEFDTHFRTLLDRPREIAAEMWRFFEEKLSVEDCGICLGPMKPTDRLFRCDSCRKMIHCNCVDRWIGQQKKKITPGEPPPDKGCVFCRKSVT